MTEITNAAAVAENEVNTKSNVEATPRRRRRGVGSVQGSTLKQFHESMACKNSLFLGILDNVHVEYSTLDENGNNSFPGCKQPRLVFNFLSPDGTASRSKTFFPIPSNTNTWEHADSKAREARLVPSQLSYLRHFLDVLYFKGRKPTEEEEILMELPLDEEDEDGSFIPNEPQVVCDAYGVMYKNIANMLNGITNMSGADGAVPKPTYKDANGNPIKLWLKLIRAYKSNGVWALQNKNGDLDFPTFVGSGVIEVVKANEMPKYVNIDLAKESITPKEVAKKATAPAMPGVGGVDMATMMTAPAMPNMDAVYMDPNNSATPF